jgi:acylphosphatase
LAPNDRARLDATVRGRVQGVGFRYHVLRAGMDLDLRGWVANEADGSVRTVAEGPRADLESFLGTLEEGPPAANVDRVVVAWGPAVGDLGPFSIRSGAHRGD